MDDSDMITRLDLEQRISNMPDRHLLEFVARKVYDTCESVNKNTKRIKDLENTNKRSASVLGAISGTITAVVIGVLNFLLGRNWIS